MKNAPGDGGLSPISPPLTGVYPSPGQQQPSGGATVSYTERDGRVGSDGQAWPALSSSR